MRPRLSWTLFVVMTAGAVMTGGAREAAAADPELGERGRFTLSAERLFGYAHSTETTSVGGVETSQSSDTFTLLTSPLGGVSTGYGWPRLALDAFVGNGFSVGGAIGMVHFAPDEGDSITGFMVAPRAGYAVRLASRLWLWPRLGFTYAQFSTNPPGGAADVTVKSYALTLEAPFAINVAPRVALHLGPAFDFGVGGTTAIGGAGIDTTTSDYGGYAGLVVIL